MGSALGHTPPTATRAIPPPVAGEGNEAIEPAPRTPKPCETSAEDAALQELAKLLLDDAGKALSVAQYARHRL